MRNFIVACCFLPILLNAQVPKVKSKPVRSIYLLPNLMSLNYTMTDIQQAWAPKAGISVGLQVKLKIVNDFFLRTGLGYGFKGYRNMETGLRFGSTINPMTWVVSESKIETKGVFHELQLPLALQYDFKEDRFFIAVGADFVAQMGHTAKTQYLYGDGTKDFSSFENKSQLNIASTLSMGYAMPLNQHYTLSIAPTFSYYVKEWILHDSQMYNYGIKLLLDYKP